MNTPLQELRVTRIDHNLCDVARMLRGRRVLLVRYTKTHLVAIYL
jgi:hypothetical protein